MNCVLFTHIQISELNFGRYSTDMISPWFDSEMYRSDLLLLHRNVKSGRKKSIVMNIAAKFFSKDQF